MRVSLAGVGVDRVALASVAEPLHPIATYADVADVKTLVAAVPAACGTPVVLRTLDTRELMRGTVALTTSYLFERELFLTTGGCCAAFARSMDDYWALVNISRFTPVHYVDEPSVLYRIHPSSASRSTSYPLPLLTALAAARFGGSLVPPGQARDPQTVGALEPFWHHQLLALARSGAAGLRDALALAQLLAATDSERRRLRRQMLRAALRRALRRR